jgi:pilus assembly protein TadC
VLTVDLAALAVGVLVSATVVVLLRTGSRPEREARTAFRREPHGAWLSSTLRQRSAGRRQRATTRARAPTSEEVAGSMVLLAVALQSGCGVVEAIEQVAEVAPRAAGAELAVVAAAWRWGVAEEQAWAEVDPRWSRTAVALRLAREAGVAPSSLLLSGAADLRDARLAAIDVAAARLGVRLVVPLGVAFLPAFVLTTIVPVVLALARQVLA